MVDFYLADLMQRTYEDRLNVLDQSKVKSSRMNVTHQVLLESFLKRCDELELVEEAVCRFLIQLDCRKNASWQL